MTLRDHTPLKKTCVKEREKTSSATTMPSNVTTPSLTLTDTPTIAEPAIKKAELSYNDRSIIAKYVTPAIRETVVSQTSSTETKESSLKSKRIAVCVDEGAEASYALAWALKHLTDDSNAQAQFILVNVRPFAVPEHFIHPTKFFPSTAMDMDEEYVESVETFNREKSHDALEKAAQQVLDKGLACEAIALRGDPRDQILKLVEDEHVDCLVVGSRGLQETSFRGSLSNYLVHHATCAVIVPKICE
ncbi:hypothetical protein BDR26DRAFT_862900 [Obelidium mucronatum]|nr:hypothetical protein BDR26DRAFT_862900 [Obelidium mucronatum]